MTSRTHSSRVAYWKETRRRGSGLFAAAVGSLEEARAVLPLAPDLMLFHPGFCPRTPEGETGMLAALAYPGSANQAVLEQAAAVLPACAPCPVALGVCGTDPDLRRPNSLHEWKEGGVEGLCNFPTVGLVDGLFREDLEAEGMGFAWEVDSLSQARQLGLFTVGLASRPDSAAALRSMGCDILVLHLGLDAATHPRGLAASGEVLNSYLYAVRGGGGQVPLLLLHGDALTSPADEAEIAGLVGGGAPWDGILAVGGVERIRAIRDACAWVDLPDGGEIPASA